jgi:hypothetical protein
VGWLRYRKAAEGMRVRRALSGIPVYRPRSGQGQRAKRDFVRRGYAHLPFRSVEPFRPSAARQSNEEQRSRRCDFVPTPMMS